MIHQPTTPPGHLDNGPGHNYAHREEKTMEEQRKARPIVVALDMGHGKPLKYAIWSPDPVHCTKTGKAYYIHPRKRYTTREAAEKALQGGK